MTLSVNERMNRIELKVEEGFEKIGEKIDNLSNTYVTRREYEAMQNASKGTSSNRQMVISIVISVGAFLLAIYKL